MRNFILILTLFINVNFCESQQTLIAYDYIETYDWFGSWWTPAATTGYFTNISVSPTASAAIYGAGNNTIEQDWYVLPSITVDATKDHIFKMRLAAQTISGPTASTAGLDVGDYITVQLSKDGGGYVSELRVRGFSNSYWDYSSTATASKTSNGILDIFTPGGIAGIPDGGDRTSLGDGYSYIELLVPAGPSSIAIDIQARANRGGEDWWMDNFELYEITPISLPIEMGDFWGESTTEGNVLNWTTITELDNDYFNLSYSQDGIDFIVLTQIKGAGSSQSPKNYRFIHTSPLVGVGYYKITQFDYNGESEEFPIIAINRLIKGILFSDIFPNPSTNVFFFNYNGKMFNTPINVKIESSLGVIVMEGEIDNYNNSQSISFDLNGVNKGIYLVKITQGNNSETKRLLLH